RLNKYILPDIRITIFFTRHKAVPSIRILLLLLVLIVSCKPATAPAGGDAYRLDSLPLIYQPHSAVLTPAREAQVSRIRRYFNRRHHNQGFNGTVLFAEHGEIIFNKAYGFANFRTRDTLTLESAFQLASVSKPITSLAVLSLVEEGKLSLEDTIQKFIPDFPYHGISIRMLLSHRSGLPNYMYLADKVWPDRQIPLTNRDMVDILIKYHPERYYPPNHRYNYSNTNYALLAYLVEQVSGIPFAEFVRLRIFKPLRMNNSSIYVKTGSLKNPQPVKGYISYRREADDTYLNGVVGDKGVYTSVIDLLRLDQALYEGQPISFRMQKKAFTPQHKDLRIWDNYGLGWRLNLQDSHNPVIYHSGWWKGFRTYFIRETGTGRTMIILSNTLRGSRFGVQELRNLWDLPASRKNLSE
ncbi:MAG: beta-lactamase family protein, partial [Bacteroidales bacterium]|nr:beta-lactamase family protein [Bacteroidales bacterium]